MHLVADTVGLNVNDEKVTNSRGQVALLINFLTMGCCEDSSSTLSMLPCAAHISLRFDVRGSDFINTLPLYLDQFSQIPLSVAIISI